MHPTTGQRNETRGLEGTGPFTFNQVLLEELRRLRPGVEAFREREAAGFRDPADPRCGRSDRSADLLEIYQEISTFDHDAPDDRKPLSALCLSGGGIRSATFNLGVIQALARLGVLDRLDYLSSVSGGGYVAGWLKAWMRRSGTRTVIDQLASRTPENLLAPEPGPLDRLREHSNYLTPRLGILSLDTWTAAALVLRNLLLNWLVIMPALAAIVALPQAYLLALHVPLPSGTAPRAIFGLALGLASFASAAIHRARHPWRGDGASNRHVFAGAVLPLFLSVILLTIAASRVRTADIGAFDLAAFAVLWCVLIPLGGWSLHEPFWSLAAGRRWPWRELLALLVSGALSAGIFLLLTAALPYLAHRPILYALLAAPALLGLHLVGRAFFVALAGIGRRDAAGTSAGALEDADREWWGRLSGLILLVAASWLALAAVALVGWHFAVRIAEEYMPAAFTAIGGATGLMAALIGKSGATPAVAGGADRRARRMNWSLAAAAPVFIVALVILLAHGTVLLGRLVTGEPDLLAVPGSLLRHEAVPVAAADWLRFLAGVPVGLAAFAILAGRAVNTNDFSLHGLYRNRLIRAYLGASNPARRPDPFTGFDVSDNLKLHDLWTEPGSPGPECRRPLPVINVTLNLVRGERLAWQERKAESFSMTPFFCGNFYEGYRRSTEYGGRGGISLGTALTISGAAANPNMGYHSSPAVGFLLTLLNGRLGAWLGNTNARGTRTYRDAGPKWALRPLFAELFGLTSARTRYVNLSDGGHFDNLGLYEMVLRRCRFILLSDAGRDPGAGFEDLGNAIRKIRIDFGISIDFDEPILTLPRGADGKGLYCAVGTIRYSDADGTAARDGTLIYIKPTLEGRGDPIPYDVFSYARQSDDFPHESTRDQWFSESQFESYRALGRHTVEQIARALEGEGAPRPGSWTLRDFEDAARRYVAAAAPREAPAPAGGG